MLTTPGGTLLMPWCAGPSDGIAGPVFVSVTDFLATTDEDVHRIGTTGWELGRTWPVLSGAVGLWLWGRQAERRGGSISIWETESDMRRFVRWPVHVAIMREWGGRVTVTSDSWESPRFDSDEVRARALALIESRSIEPSPHAGANPPVPTESGTPDGVVVQPGLSGR